MGRGNGREHCYWGFQHDRTGIEMRHKIGVDKLIWAVDFPHQDSDWPHSMELVKWNFEGVPTDKKYRIVAGNVIEFFHLDALPATGAAEPARRAAQTV
jgi:hypothetical protein